MKYSKNIYHIKWDYGLFILVFFLLNLTGCQNTATLKPEDLRTDYRITPMGINRFPPMLSWRIRAEDCKGVSQSAWQIQAAHDRRKLNQGGHIWDSGKVSSDLSTHIPYGGPLLKGSERIWWRVKVWDESGHEGSWSDPTWFETGLVDERYWDMAAWIGCDRDYQAPELAPEEMMGHWVVTPRGKPVVSIFKDVDLPGKPIVSAKAWWGLSRNVAQAGVVVNYDRMTGAQRAPMNRSLVVRGHGNGGFLDLAFYLEPGVENRIEMHFNIAVTDIAATIGMLIVFADGQEMLLMSGDDWQVQLEGEADPVESVTVAEGYGGSSYGYASVMQETNLAPAWFRQTIEVNKGLKRARLYLCALGQGRTFLNGEEVYDDLLSPPQSDYDDFAYYTTHDIGAFLRRGSNALSVLLDGGWYHQVGGFGTVFSYGRPGLKAAVLLEYGDGERQWILSDDEWQWREGAIRSANIYRGERVDYRLDHDFWKKPGYGEGWHQVQLLSDRTPRTIAMDVVPVRPGQELKPVQVWKTGAKTWVYDIGEMIHGWIRLTIDEPEGSPIRLRYTEYASDGEMYNVPTSHWWCHGVTQSDMVISDGKRRVFEPMFTPKSFRFVEVSGLSREPAKGDISAILVHTDAPAIATFESSDQLLDRLFDNGMRTFRNYMNHMVSDLPRERCLWGAESIYSSVPASYCFDWAPNHRLMHMLWWTGPKAPGNIPGNIAVGKRGTDLARDFTWSVTPVFIASKMYIHYGDIEPARMFYKDIRHFLRYFESHSEDGVKPGLHLFGDHAPLRDVPRVPSDNQLIAMMNFFEAQKRFARIAEALGETEDAHHALAHAEKIRRSIMDYYDEEKHCFGNTTHNSLALAYEVISDPDSQHKLAASLVEVFRQNGFRFDAGFMGFNIFPMLSKYGYVDDALRILLNTESPGPAWSVKYYDATSFWETYWLDKQIQLYRGLNFIAFGHSIGWMITDLAGIQYDYRAPNGKQMILSPKFPVDLDHVKGSLFTPYGMVESKWEKETDATIKWEVNVPPNSTAFIRLPGFDQDRITINGKRIIEVAQSFFTEDNEFSLASGNWRIEIML